MKTFKRLLLAVVAIIAVAGTANAQFKFGPRVGINVNSMHFNESVFKSDNRTGFTAGLEAEFTVPVIGVGLDASLMYVRRNLEMTAFRPQNTVITSKFPSTLSGKSVFRLLARLSSPTFSQVRVSHSSLQRKQSLRLTNLRL